MTCRGDRGAHGPNPLPARSIVKSLGTPPQWATLRPWLEEQVVPRMNTLLIFRRIAAVLALALLAVLPVRAEQQANPVRPEWCRELPRPAYKNLERIVSPEPW